MCTTKFVDVDTPTGRAVLALDEAILTIGLATTSEYARGADYQWCCDPCFEDFRDEFGWVLDGSS